MPATRRPKRSRYTVDLSHPLRGRKSEVILAYGADGAKSYYVGRGWTVERVRKGDFVNFIRPESGWSLNPTGYQKAIETLGLVWRVKIGTTRHQGGQRGVYRLKTDAQGLYHEITMKSWLTPEEASSTLWHELTHAMQAEREAQPVARDLMLDMRDVARYAISECITAWRQCPGRAGTYKRRPIEHEANRTARQYATTIPVAR